MDTSPSTSVQKVLTPVTEEIVTEVFSDVSKSKKLLHRGEGQHWLRREKNLIGPPTFTELSPLSILVSRVLDSIEGEEMGSDQHPGPLSAGSSTGPPLNAQAQTLAPGTFILGRNSIHDRSTNNLEKEEITASPAPLDMG